MTTDDTALWEALHVALTLTPGERGRVAQEPSKDIRASLRLAAQIDAARAAVLPIIRKAERDAAREALDGLIANMTQIANGSPDPLTRTSATITARLAGEYKLNVYPEEAP